MSSTPLIRSLNIEGGTFYAFSSAANDLTKADNDDNIKFDYSKIVAIDIPNISSLDFNTFSSYRNFLQFDTIDGAIFNGLNSDPNINLAESFQNYALNLESSIMNDDDYNHNLYQSVAERVFFKWLKEIGGIRFREAATNEVSSGVSGRFTEENEALSGSEQYKKVIKYIGDIDIVNKVQKGGDTYTEVYLSIPTEAGSTPTILFKTVEDQNYAPSKVFTGDSEYLEGRSESTSHPDGLSINAFYDYDANVNYTDSDAKWHEQPSSGGLINSYFTEPDSFIDASNIDIKKYPADFGNPSGFGGVAYRRSKLDGIQIDFDNNSYNEITTDSSISNISQFNSSSKSSNFEFNAILVYYDIYDKTNPSATLATNLYGILFLDNVTSTADGGYIQRFKKIKPNPITKLNGNSYGLKLNFKHSSSVTNTGVDTLINEYNTFSMGLFADASVQLQNAVTYLSTLDTEVTNLKSKIDSLENTMYTVTNYQELKTKVDILEESLQNAQLAFGESTSLLDLISSNSDKIQKIVNGEITSELQYNTNVINASNGISIDKSIPNKIKIENNLQQYSIVDPYDSDGNSISTFDISVSNPRIYFNLKPFTNLLRIVHSNSANGNINIYIKDSTYKFKKGQVVKVVFPLELNMNSQSINIYTDFENRFSQGSYGYLISTINFSDLISKKPIFEIICLDETNYSFAVDVIK
jgi:hypothetical protein